MSGRQISQSSHGRRYSHLGFHTSCRARVLLSSQADLETLVPSSTGVAITRSSKQSTVTQGHARALRVALEDLDDIQRGRRDQVSRATRLADAEDITPRILKAASAFEQWKEVQPAMLEDVLDEELAKYEKFSSAIAESETKQEALLATIQVRPHLFAYCCTVCHSLPLCQERNDLFLRSRKDDPIVKDREHALQSLDLAYHKYKEITRNLDEGLKVCTATFYSLHGALIACGVGGSSTMTSRVSYLSLERVVRNG